MKEDKKVKIEWEVELGCVSYLLIMISTCFIIHKLDKIIELLTQLTM